jgi:hypothetical protein
VVGLALGLGLGGCGYQPVHGQSAESAGAERLHVVLVRARVADAITSDEVASGVRTTLAKEGALASGAGYPRIEIEVLRADESSEGVAAIGGAHGVPRARASEVGIVARAWIVRTLGGVQERDTGDVRAEDVVATPPRGETGGALAAESFRHDDALRAVARRVGQRLALRILGHPVAKDEPLGE